MAYFGFTNKLLAGDTIQIFNYGNCKRDFTYVDDIVEGVKRVMQCAPEKVNGEDGLPIPPYRVYNIGNNSPENLLDFVDILQQELIRAGVLPEDYDFEAHKKLAPMQPGHNRFCHPVNPLSAPIPAMPAKMPGYLLLPALRSGKTLLSVHRNFHSCVP